MKTTPLLLSCLAAGLASAAEPEWNAASIQECARACLTGILDGYMNAIFKHDAKAAPPLAIDVRMTENTGQIELDPRYVDVIVRHWQDDTGQKSILESSRREFKQIAFERYGAEL